MSNFKPKGISAALAVIGAMAAPASATPVTISQSFSLSQLLSGGSANLQFDISAQLSSQGFAATDVISGGLVAYGLSDPAYGAPAAQAYGAYNVTGTTSHTGYYSYYYPGYSSCSWWGGCYYSPGYTAYAPYTVTDYIETRSRDVLNQDNVADVMQVTAGGTSATATASQTLHTVSPYGAATSDGSYCTYDYYGNCVVHYQYSQQRDVYDAIYGQLQQSLGFDALALQDIWTDGILNVGVGAPVGQFLLQNIDLTVQVEHAAPGPSVPEPGTLSLMGAAIAAGVVTRRRRRKESKE
ncbi:MAG: PEP-CTERM sorting domain-containing protein [Nitrosomonadales bacterium]|nr:PEP-CTERM sorting domain-containing protein [Nitrosomonadales bacterium]